jgi:polyphosphate glucokinase
MYKDGIVEKYASNQARKDKRMSYSEWGKVLNNVLLYMYRLFYPEIFIIGGGISKRFHLFGKYLKPGVPVIAAKNFNEAGIIGAAWYAGNKMKTPLSP